MQKYNYPEDLLQFELIEQDFSYFSAASPL